MKSKYLLPVSLIIMLIILSNQSQVYCQARLNVKINFTEQETRELEKIKGSGITLRTIFAKLAKTGDKQAPAKVEEMVFNKMGLPVEKKRFNYYLTVDERTEFKYNSKGQLISKIVYDGNNKVTEQEITKLDKNGKPLEISTDAYVRGVLHKTKRVMKYDKNGLLLETKGYDKGKDFLVKEVYGYKDGILVSKKMTNFKGHPLGSEVYEFDSQNRKIKESASNIRYEPQKDSATNKMVSAAIEDKADFTFKYDDKGNLTEIKAPDYKQVFTYNEKGDCTRDIIYDNIGKRQNDNEFIYDERGLLKRIVRYYGDGSPGAYIDYVYETGK